MIFLRYCTSSVVKHGMENIAIPAYMSTTRTRGCMIGSYKAAGISHFAVLLRRRWWCWNKEKDIRLLIRAHPDTCFDKMVLPTIMSLLRALNSLPPSLPPLSILSFFFSLPVAFYFPSDFSRRLGLINLNQRKRLNEATVARLWTSCEGAVKRHPWPNNGALKLLQCRKSVNARHFWRNVSHLSGLF
jgi:hypothetical protein